jgi:hypothetical protein
LPTFALLLTLSASCGYSYPVAAPVDPCRVPAFPPPLDVYPIDCGEYVCWTVEDQLEWIRWEQGVNDYWWAVVHCPWVVETKNAP